MCTQDSAGYPSRVHLIISRLETERGVGFEPRKRDTRPVAALKTIRELQNDLMQKINKYEPIYFGAYPTNNSVDIRSSSESESNSDSDCEQEARPATGKWAFSKCDIVSDLVVRAALDYLKSLGRHLRRRIPPVTLQNLAVVTVTASVSLPRMVTNLVIYPSCRLVFGTLYPAYASYKAVRTKNVKEYVKWMMYWIVFALFTCAETVTDVFFSWFPFYYEVKILLVLWLLSPATKGSSILYRKFVHPALCRREQEIDEYISKAKDQGYHTVLNLGTKGVNYATNVIMQTAIKGGGGLVQQIRRSYSLSDLSVSDEHSECRSQQEIDEADDVVLADPRLVRRSTGGHGRGRSPRPQSAPRMDMIFPEVDLVHSRSVNSRDSKLSHIRSSEDISSAYVPDAPNSQDLLRTASVGGATRTRSKVTRSTFTSIKRPGAAEDDDVIIEDVEEGEPSSILNYVLPIPQSDGTMCLPYSNDIISEYLRFVMNNEIQKRIENTNKVDNEYEQYLKLKEVYDSESKVSEKLKVATSIDRSIDNVVLLKEDNQSKIRVLEPEPVLITPPNDTASNATPSKKENSSIISTSNLKEKVNLPNESDSKIVETSSQDDNTLRPDAHVNKNNKISEESRSIGASSSNLSSEDETGEGEFTTPNSSPVMKSKINKNIKHKKRHAPPPPISHSSSPSDRNESVDKLGAKTKEEQNVANVLLKASSTSNLENINDKDCVLSGVSVKRSESSVSHTPVKRKQRTKSKSSKGHKNESPLSKLMHLPSKFAFWNNAENSDQFSASDNNDGSNENIPCDGLNSNIKFLNTSIDNSTSSNSTKTTDPIVVTNNLESEEEQFLDATDTEPIKPDESSTADMAHNNDEITIPVVAVEKEGYVNKVTSVKETDNFTYIPLKIETLIVNTESKSTDV